MNTSIFVPVTGDDYFTVVVCDPQSSAEGGADAPKRCFLYAGGGSVRCLGILHLVTDYWCFRVSKIGLS